MCEYFACMSIYLPPARSAFRSQKKEPVLLELEFHKTTAMWVLGTDPDARATSAAPNLFT